MQLQTIQNKIYEIRGHKVMIDFDLAQLYETETKVLKQAVRRNMDRFPSDFMFELTKEEYDSLRVQGIANYDDESLRSQIVTIEIETLETGRGKHSKYLPFAYLSNAYDFPKVPSLNAIREGRSSKFFVKR